jgi:uncharacterized membrane protein YhaH (DUF805 family)
MQPTNGFAWFLAVLGKYVEFQGRARRREYWYFTLFATIIGMSINIMDATLETPWPGAIWSLAIFLPSLGVAVRRMHDSNRSGWWILLPIVNLVFLCFDSDPSENRFGPCPKAGMAAPYAAPGSRPISMTSLEQIEKLAQLRDKGVLTEDEFQMKKAALL